MAIRENKKCHCNQEDLYCVTVTSVNVSEYICIEAADFESDFMSQLSQLLIHQTYLQRSLGEYIDKALEEWLRLRRDGGRRPRSPVHLLLPLGGGVLLVEHGCLKEPG